MHDRDDDLTAEFWGGAPTWRTSGSTPRVPGGADRRTRRTRTDRTGPIERTRTHRIVEADPTASMPAAARADGPSTGALAWDVFDLDGDAGHLDLPTAELRAIDRPVPARRSATPARGLWRVADDATGAQRDAATVRTVGADRASRTTRSRRAHPAGAGFEGLDRLSARYADEHPTGANAAPTAHARPDQLLDDDWLEPTTSAARGWADRLGLAAVDPLLLRLGAIVLIGVLLTPIALAFRPAAPAESLRVAATPLGSGVAGVAGALDEAATVTVAGATDEPSTTGAAAGTAEGSTSSSSAASTAAPTSASAANATESAGAASEAAPSAARSAAAGSAEQRSAPAVAAAQPATATETAERVEPECGPEYTVHAGDYWLRIADGAGVGLADVLRLNGATVDTPLYAGDVVCLPVGASMPSPPPTTAPPTTAPPATTPPTTARPTTTAAPTTTAPTATFRPPSGPVSASQAEAIIREVWPDHLEDRAIEIAYRESRLIPTAYNGWCCYGLFQIYWNVHKGWLSGIGITSSQQLLDARINASVALEIYTRAGGWGPWSVA
jgi:LysM repeat protein